MIWRTDSRFRCPGCRPAAGPVFLKSLGGDDVRDRKIRDMDIVRTQVPSGVG